MTVKCLEDHEKSEMAQLYAAGLCSSDDLAKAYDVSKRTVNRVMVEQGVNRVRIYKPSSKPSRAQAEMDLPITMEPSSQDIIIDETPTAQPQQPHFIIRLLQVAKNALAYPFK
jgi:hypothetical protein